MRKGTTRRDTLQDVDLPHELREVMKDQFAFLDKLNLGYIELFQLQGLLEAVGETVTDDKMQKVQAAISVRGLSKLDYPAALRIWCYFRELGVEEEVAADDDILYAFVAMGGGQDRSGTVSKQRLMNIISVQFGLTIDIEEMLEEAGIESSKELTYADFTALFGPEGADRPSRLFSLLSVTS